MVKKIVRKYSSSTLFSLSCRFNYSIVLSTEVGNGAQGYTVPVEASMEWPHIASARTVTFPLTIIGNSSVSFHTNTSVLA